jgi:transposase
MALKKARDFWRTVIPSAGGIWLRRFVMMGQQTGDQSQLFYLFNLERRIPEGHLLRRINPVVSRILTELREKLVPFYSEIGRPSIDPELMIRMLIIGYCYGIRFERRLCEELELHLAYRWFCRLDLDDKVPDHSTFSVNRHGRFRDSDILRQVFEAVVRACMDAGLVKGEGFAVDASVLEANASRYHGKAPDEIDWSVPELQTRAAAEFLAGLDDEDLDANRKPPKLISPSDPCSAWTAKANKRVQFGYGLNYLIDIENAIIVDVEATPARTYDEVAATKTMIERTAKRMGLKPKRLAADTAYGTAKFLGWLIGSRIAPHIPVWDRSAREDGTLARSDFHWTGGEVFTFARTGRCSTPPAPCTRAPHFVIGHPSSTAKSLPSRCSAVPMARHDKFPAMFMNIPRRDAPVDADQGVHQIARSAQTRRDALCPLEDSSWLRAHAAARPFWRTRRVPPRRYRAEPQDLGVPIPRTTRSEECGAPLRSLVDTPVALASTPPIERLKTARLKTTQTAQCQTKNLLFQRHRPLSDLE